MYHIAIPVTDMDQSRSFYEKLGFHTVDNWEKPDQNLTGIWMEGDNGFRIELILHPDNKTISLQEITEVQHLGIKVKDLDKILQELTKDTIEIIAPPTPGVSVKRFAFIKDPAGFPVELFEQ